MIVALQICFNARCITPLRVRDVFAWIVNATQQLFGSTAGLADHEWRALFFPILLGLGGLIRRYISVDDSNNRHGRYLRSVLPKILKCHAIAAVRSGAII